MSQRPGTSMKSRTALRTGGSRIDSARNIRLGSATMFALGDPAGPLFQASRYFFFFPHFFFGSLKNYLNK